jgi:arylsulfatase A-like enzyme
MNILIFMTDQQRAATVLPGDPYKAITPVLDTFRQESVTFGRAYGPSPHCCPSRATFMTGLMPSQHGVWHNVCVTNAISRGLKEGVRPWSVDLQAAGYRMMFAGKWHVSNDQQPAAYGWEHIHPASHCHGEGLSPLAQEAQARAREAAVLRKPYPALAPDTAGAIQRPGYPPYVHYGTAASPHLAPYYRNGDPEDPFGDRTVVDSALTALDEQQTAQPWCLFVGTLGPHDPYIPPARFLELYAEQTFPLPPSFDDPMLDKPALYRRTRARFAQLDADEHSEAIRHYLAFCSYEDWLFGRLIAKLKQRGEYDNTMIVYVSDHGDYLADHGLWCKGLPAFLGAYHVPAIVRMPGGQRGAVSQHMVSLADFAPTIHEVAGLPANPAHAGRSLVPLVRGSEPTAWRDALFFQTNGNETYGIQRSVLTDRWMFVYNGFDYDELYDLQTDPHQMQNLAADPAYRPVIRALYQRIWQFGMEHDESHINDYIMTALADYGPADSPPPEPHL